LGPGETPEQAAQRELLEEVGIPSVKLHFLYEYIMRSPVETEWVSTFQIVWDGPIQLQPEEIEEGRFWDLAEIRKTLGSGLFTPNFEDEFQRWSSHREPGVNE
jgi:8-oxo-dGTP pyrophosphatase MutT (NUDIX family)